MEKILAAVVVMATVVAHASAACPPDTSGLASFASLFPGLQKSDMITINEPVVLDVESVNVTMITISAAGTLVFGRGINITVRAKSIMVMGVLEIGTLECSHDDQVNIILEGERSADQSQVDHEGEKVIGVMGAGEVHIRGTPRISWTKLTTTIPHIASYSDNATLVKHLHSNSGYNGFRAWKEGPAVYVLGAKADVITYDAFDFNRPGDVAKEQADVNKVIALLDTVNDGELVALSMQNYYETSADVSALWDKLEQVASMSAGELLWRDLYKYDAYSLIFIKGSTPKFVQAVDPLISKLSTQCRCSLEFGNYTVTAVSTIVPDKKSASVVEFRVLDPSIGYPLITVSDDVSTWKEGDELMITSTDYDPSHTETVKIRQIVSANSFRIENELEFRHFGEVENRVDMRAEVALLSRNIKIEGEMSRGCPVTNQNCDRVPFDTFGGHLKIMHTFGGAYIHGAEFTHMGQATQKGTYPIHFHMLKNITDKVAEVKSNSIHHTLQRCITVHGTYGTSPEQPGVVLGDNMAYGVFGHCIFLEDGTEGATIIKRNLVSNLEDNVAYDVFGHCIFLEDGAEAATIIKRNLVAHVKHIDNGFFTTDNDGVAAFWITNPKVEMISNVAAGSEGFGIWYTFPESPVGPSVGLVYQQGEAFRTKLWTVDNNVVHSNYLGGFNLENILQDDNGTVDDHLKYNALEVPTDESSAPIKVQVTRLTAYKNRNRNVWTRGGLEFMQLSSAESKFGSQLARANIHVQQFITKSVYIGQSQGNVELAGYPGALAPADLVYQFGVGFIYGPQYISDVWFKGFKNAADHSYVSGALSFKPEVEFLVSSLTQVEGLRFGFQDSTEGNRVFVGNTPEYGTLKDFGNANGNEMSTFRDTDGSVTACTPGDVTGDVIQVVKPEKFLLTPNCKCRTNWQMCPCTDIYGTMKLSAREMFSGAVADFNESAQFRRLSYSDSSDVAYEDHTALETKPRALMVLGNQAYYYDMQYMHGFPKRTNIEVAGVESGHNVVVGLCLPEGATSGDLTLSGKTAGRTKTIKNEEFVWATSLDDVRNDDNMTTVFLDGRILYLHFATHEVRAPGETQVCLQSQCTFYDLTMTSDMTYTPCYSPTTAELNTDNVMADFPAVTCTFASSDPGEDWGVGDTTASHNGAWGVWGPWSACDTQNKKTRSRECDSPTPFGGGTDCPDVGTETVDCAR